MPRHGQGPKAAKQHASNVEDDDRGLTGKAKKEAAAESKRMLRKQQNKHEEKVSWRKKVGGICAIAFMCGVGFLSAASTIVGFMMGNGVVTLDVRDSAQLKNVLFGGEPWLVYCVNNQTISHRLPKVLEEATNGLKRELGVQVGVLGCWDMTESGRSVAKRFKLKLSPPLMFMVANGNSPRTIDLVGLSKPEDLIKKVKPALKVETGRVDTLKKWGTLCTSRRSCVVIGHENSAQRDTALNVFRPLLKEHRGVKVVTLDTSFWRLKLDEAFLEGRPQKATGRADVICLARLENPQGNQTHSGSFLLELDSTSASRFMQECGQRAGLLALGHEPKIFAKPSKPKQATPQEPRKPSPSPSSSSSSKKVNVDRVGSRASMEQQEDALFEAVDEEDADEMSEDQGAEGDDDDMMEDEAETEASSDEVEL